MTTAARHFSALAEHALEAVRPTGDSSQEVGTSDEIIEYRVNRRVIDQFKEVMRKQAVQLAAQPAERRY
jgi:hypothetical protein